MALPQFDIEEQKKGYWRTVAYANQGHLSEWLQEYINEFYPTFIREIVGADAFLEIEAQDPLQQKYIDLFNGSYWTDTKGCKLYQDGLLDVVRGFFYFYFVRDTSTIGDGGHASSIQETSNTVDRYQLGSIAAERWNASIIVLAKNITPYIHRFSSYTIQISSSSFLGGGQYQINVSDTTYLYDNDEVEIEGEKYVVQSLVDDTSFVISEIDNSLDFAGLNATYEPFKDFPTPDFIGKYSPIIL